MSGELDPVEVEALVARQHVDWARGRKRAGDEGCSWEAFDDVVQSFERLASAHAAAWVAEKEAILKMIQEATVNVALGRPVFAPLRTRNGDGPHEEGETR